MNKYIYISLQKFSLLYALTIQPCNNMRVNNKFPKKLTILLVKKFIDNTVYAKLQKYRIKKKFSRKLYAFK